MDSVFKEEISNARVNDKDDLLKEYYAFFEQQDINLSSTSTYPVTLGDQIDKIDKHSSNQADIIANLLKILDIQVTTGDLSYKNLDTMIKNQKYNQLQIGIKNLKIFVLLKKKNKNSWMILNSF